jgi:hypothetical protein
MDNHNEYEIEKLRAELKVALEDVEYYKNNYYLAHTECARRGAELTRLQNIINERLKYSD